MNNSSEYLDIIQRQEAFFASGVTRSVANRIDSLIRLKVNLKNYEKELLAALQQELGKPEFESYATEIGIVYDELSLFTRSLRKWSAPRKVRTPLYLFPTKSYEYSDPYGKVLIFAPFNYPVQLLLLPLIGAVAAGNTVIVRQSESVPQVAAVLTEIISQSFPAEHVVSLDGGRELNIALLKEKFDYIFFTGGETFGKIILKAAAEHLTPCTLELGGKSPCVITASANLEKAAERIMWGKTINSGQTCVAPDYVLIESSVRESFIRLCATSIRKFYGDSVIDSPDYGRMVNDAAWERVSNLIYSTGTVRVGGKSDRKSRFIEPTIIDAPDIDSELMTAEIFGPLLPVISFDNLSDAIRMINARPKPLSLYIFSESKHEQKKILSETSSGGAAINDTVVQVGSSSLPFGGVGNSGMGRYHGKESFFLFSHIKGVVKTPTAFTLPVKLPPYGSKLNIIKKILK